MRKWDVRLGSGNAGNIAETESDPTTSLSSKRPRGITSIVKGATHTKGMVFGLAFDSQIHIYNEIDLKSIAIDYGSNRTSKTMRCMSFWIKLSMNRSGQQLLSGGQDGNAYIWSTSSVGAEDARQTQITPVMTTLEGHEGEVGAVDFGGDNIVTCGADEVVRLWREVEDVG